MKVYTPCTTAWKQIDVLCLSPFFSGLSSSIYYRSTLIRPAARTINLGFRLATRIQQTRLGSGSAIWKQRQSTDQYVRDARTQGLRSRAGFKLLEIHERHHIFKSGQTVIDLGFAPGAWSQIAQRHTRPGGRILGVDVIPAASPAPGIDVLHGDITDPDCHTSIEAWVAQGNEAEDVAASKNNGRPVDDVDRENHSVEREEDHADGAGKSDVRKGKKIGRSGVDVVISDMLMNTSGIPFKDHAVSMDLCHAALQLAVKVLRSGGKFVCKFYQGSEDAELETKMKQFFRRVTREKPRSSRKESREAYFVALGRN